MYIVQISMIANLDFAYVSEMATRLAMVLSVEFEPFLRDEYELSNAPLIDYYLIGFRWGMLWKMMFDLKITS